MKVKLKNAIYSYSLLTLFISLPTFAMENGNDDFFDEVDRGIGVIRRGIDTIEHGFNAGFRIHDGIENRRTAPQRREQETRRLREENQRLNDELLARRLQERENQAFYDEIYARQLQNQFQEEERRNREDQERMRTQRQTQPQQRPVQQAPAGMGIPRNFNPCHNRHHHHHHRHHC